MQQQHAGYTPSTSTTTVDDSTPTSERSFSFPNVPPTISASVANPRTRSPAPRSSFDLSRQSSRRSRTPSRTGSPALRPLSAGLQAHGDEWLLSGGGSQGNRDESAFYQAETQTLTRENQMLRMRIRELGSHHHSYPQNEHEMSCADATGDQNDRSMMRTRRLPIAPLRPQTWLLLRWGLRRRRETPERRRWRVRIRTEAGISRTGKNNDAPVRYCRSTRSCIVHSCITINMSQLVEVLLCVLRRPGGLSVTLDWPTALRSL